MAIDTRRLTPGDAALLGRVADGVFDEPVHAERLAAYLAEPGHLTWAPADRELAG